ncbi:MAG: hypothetical protein FWC09_08085 [Lachnospiraceae bacterium]|nr:hypothetical protein [Lachnospiraceae bacterium]
MKSLSKNELNTTQINALTKHAFGRSADYYRKYDISQLNWRQEMLIKAYNNFKEL